MGRNLHTHNNMTQIKLFKDWSTFALENAVNDFLKIIKESKGCVVSVNMSVVPNPNHISGRDSDDHATLKIIKIVYTT